MIDTATVMQARNFEVKVLAESYGMELRRESKHEWSAACPRCGGDDRWRLRTDINRWSCHSCPGGKWWDGPELVKVIERVTYPQAVEKVLGKRDFPRVVTKPTSPQPSSWDPVKAQKTWQQARDSLWAPGGKPGQDYLEQRELDTSAWLMFHLGYGNSKTASGAYAPAVVMPWLNARGQLVALEYRFLQPQDGQRYKHIGSAKGRLFGNQANVEPGQTLLLCEGAFNAMSCWQLHHFVGLHVLSTGMKTTALTQASVAWISERYTTVIVWQDDVATAQALSANIPGAYPVHSPVLADGTKLDANALLQRGELGAVLTRHRVAAARDDRAQLERLYHELCSGAQVLQGLDDGTAAVALELAAALAQPLDLAQPEPGRWLHRALVE